MNPKSKSEIEIMRQGGKMLATILNKLAESVAPGMTPIDLSKMAAEQVKKYKLQPVLLGYKMGGLTYPDLICISINQEVVHGIPSKRAIKEGDVVKIDLTVGYKGMVVDSALTTFAGKNPSADIVRLMKGTKASLDAGVAAISGSGTRVGDISAAIQNVLNKYKLGIVRDLVGHGVGYGVHEAPNIPNYGAAGTGPTLGAGMTLAIEPMATLGDWAVDIAKDGWTVVTQDNSLAAHFEHTVLITEDGAEILTAL